MIITKKVMAQAKIFHIMQIVSEYYCLIILWHIPRLAVVPTCTLMQVKKLILEVQLDFTLIADLMRGQH